jgi:hypothetical protein
MKIIFVFGIIALCGASWADLPVAPKPILVEKGELIYSADFSDGKVPKEWVAGSKTQWEVVDGVLVGNPAPTAYQENRKSKKQKHTGGTPSSSVLVPLHDGIVQLSFKVSGKMNGAHFGYDDGSFKTGTGHVNRFAVSTKSGLELIKDDDATLDDDEDEVLDSADFKIKSDTWYTILLEYKGGEFVAHISDGPSLRGKHDKRFDRLKSDLNLPTRGGGTIYYDNLKVWAVK